MSSDTPMNKPQAAHQCAAHTSTDSKVPSLTPQEIERICKAFIRLITAKEITTNGNNNQSNTDFSAKTKTGTK